MAFPTLIVFPVSDIAGATELYKLVLGGDPYFESPITLDSKPVPGRLASTRMPRTAPRCRIGMWDDLDGTIASLTAAGATVVKKPSDVGGGDDHRRSGRRQRQLDRLPAGRQIDLAKTMNGRHERARSSFLDWKLVSAARPRPVPPRRLSPRRPAPRTVATDRAWI